MKSRARIIQTLAASVLTLLASAPSLAQKSTASSHSASASDPQKSDTLVYSATKTLIESFGELSRTAAKLSDTALKLLEAQEGTDHNGSDNRQQAPKRRENKAAEVSDDNGSPLRQIVEEVTQISTELNKGVLTNQEGRYIPGQSANDQDPPIVVEEQSEQVDIISEDNNAGGRYLWIPDSDLPAVEAVLNGENINVVDTKPAIDLKEITLWRGDSILMAIPTKRLGRFDRKLYNWLIYPKGLWHIGLAANYGELSTEDSEFLSLIQDVDLKGKIYSVKPSVSYFLRNNLCVGMRLAFTKGEMGINSFKLDIDDDMSFNIHDIKYSSDSYAAAVFIQQYFGLSRRGRFAVFNEAELSYGSGSSHFIRPFEGNLRDTRTKSQSLRLNYSPGVSIMIMKNAAFNLSFGVFGFQLKDEKQWENGEESGSRFTSGINFRFNIFNINFGVAIII